MPYSEMIVRSGLTRSAMYFQTLSCQIEGYAEVLCVLARTDGRGGGKHDA